MSVCDATDWAVEQPVCSPLSVAPTRALRMTAAVSVASTVSGFHWHHCIGPSTVILLPPPVAPIPHHVH